MNSKQSLKRDYPLRLNRKLGSTEASFELLPFTICRLQWTPVSPWTLFLKGHVTDTWLKPCLQQLWWVQEIEDTWRVFSPLSHSDNQFCQTSLCAVLCCGDKSSAQTDSHQPWAYVWAQVPRTRDTFSFNAFSQKALLARNLSTCLGSANTTSRNGFPVFMSLWSVMKNPAYSCLTSLWHVT